MRSGERDGRHGDEAGVEGFVLPSPLVTEERELRKELERLNGTWTNGPLSVIAVPRPGGGHVYLAGRTTLFTSFVERAYRLGEDDARRLVQKFPSILGGADILVRSR